jgi:hypothetical protein
MGMGSDRNYLSEKSRIESNITRVFAQAMADELGEEAAKEIARRAQACHAALSDSSPFEGKAPITIFAQRRLEIDLIKFFHRGLSEKHGAETANRIVARAIIQDAREAGRQKAASTQGPTNLLTFAKILPQWASGGALEMSVRESTETKLSYVVTRCRYADMYRDMGLSSLGYLVSCERDSAFMEGYAPNVTLKREKTIMAGSDCCDFLYKLVK